MRDNKAQKVLIIVLTNTPLHPNTMMIMPSNTLLAQRAVLGSGWSVEFASSTFIFREIDNFIDIFLVFSVIKRRICGGYGSWVCFVGFVIAKKSEENH